MTKNREGGKSIMRTFLLPELADKTFVALKVICYPQVGH